MDRQKAIAVIEAGLAKLPELRVGRPGSPEHTAFVQTTGMQLARVFGADSPITKNFSSITYRGRGQIVGHLMTLERDLARHAMDGYQAGLSSAEGILRSALELLSDDDVEHILRASRIREQGARVFISHGSARDVLERVERYVKSLGLEPVVVVHGPSEGLAVDALVSKRMAECDCAIVLATADDKLDDRFQPRPNVLHEIGLAQERFEGRVIYLKENGCTFPSNVAPKVWETFSRDNLEAAFQKIAKELRAFDLL